jgi:hypothetical protein
LIGAAVPRWGAADDFEHMRTGFPLTGAHERIACENCHVGGVFEGTPKSCGSCHNGATATGKSSGHFITNLECNECHSTAAWQPIQFSHSSPNYPGDHAGQLDCNACHLANAQNVLWAFGGYQPDCAGCHADDFKPDPHKKHENPDVRYTVGELRDCTGACHVYTDSTLTTIKKSRSGEHRVNQGDWQTVKRRQGDPKTRGRRVAANPSLLNSGATLPGAVGRRGPAPVACAAPGADPSGGRCTRPRTSWSTPSSCCPAPRR